MPLTVPVVGIFTNGAASSATRAQRAARLDDDIARANETWGNDCGLNFVVLRRFTLNVEIDADSVMDVTDQSISDAVDAARRRTNDATAIYVVYLSGKNFAPDADGNLPDGKGIALFSNFRSTTDYDLYGQVALADGALNSNIFPHEAGHGLFLRFTDPDDINSLTDVDPSNPGGDGHSDDPQNLMFPIVPRNNPLINADQCSVASQSKLIIENAAQNGGRAGRNRKRNGGRARRKRLKNKPQMVKRFNKIIAMMRNSARSDKCARRQKTRRRRSAKATCPVCYRSKTNTAVKMKSTRPNAFRRKSAAKAR
ncbi:hypothetical protein [Paenibacillus sp. CCS19]|uniref:hypothetical protein n=1 Tax=Paenibacillus sp. CCS19 TaxID=3158387 RepID=UPI00295EB41F|nr:hypothetical protein [Paenibacillus cellulosilyticus]